MSLDKLMIHRVIADGDMDGLFAAVILKNRFPDAEVSFSHPAEIRSGLLDGVIDRKTAICDLPFHPGCGLYLDHHLTNRPSLEEEAEFNQDGGICIWEDKPSAARVAWDHFSGSEELPSLAQAMDFVDRLDSGGIELQELQQGHDHLWFSRTIDGRDVEYMQMLVESLSTGLDLETLLGNPEVQRRCQEMKEEARDLAILIDERLEIRDRLAIVRMDGTGTRTNGYAVTAHAGEDCDACCIIHGWIDGSISTPDRPALSASFYTNSFLHTGGGIFNLTRMATLYDETGGGHANACGCRIKPLSSNGDVEDRDVEEADIERNLSGWLGEWSRR